MSLKFEEYAQEMGAAKNIKVHSTISSGLEEIKLPMEARRNIYLCCKEAINNAVKYSKCSELLLEVSSSDGTISFMIQDNGTGFDPGTVKRGNGIENMMRRAHALNTSLNIYSQIGKGTQIVFEKKYPNEVMGKE